MRGKADINSGKVKVYTRSIPGEKDEPVNRFAAEAGQQERHCPTFALYETAEEDFFHVSEIREGQRPDPNPLTKDSKVRTKPIPGTRAHVFERRIDMLSWQDDILWPLRQLIARPEKPRLPPYPTPSQNVRFSATCPTHPQPPIKKAPSEKGSLVGIFSKGKSNGDPRR